MNPFLSLCMIVKNEEKCLDRCLSSICNEIDEIIVIDTGSLDKTTEIAERYTTNIYHYQWNKDFAAARNFASSKATGEWIIVLDADEYVNKGDITKVKEILLNNKDQYNVYALNIVNFAGEYGERTIRNIHGRLYKNDGDIYFDRALHEQLVSKSNNRKIGILPIDIYHSGYMSDVVKEKKKSDRNLEIIKEVVKETDSAFDYYNLAQEYKRSGDDEKALENYIKAYSKKEAITIPWVVSCLMGIVRTLIELKRYNDAINILNDAEVLYEEYADFLFMKALVYREQGRIQQCKEILNKILGTYYNSYLESQDYNQYLPSKMLMEIYYKERKLDLVIKYAIDAINYNQYCILSYRYLLKSLIKRFDATQIITFLHKINLKMNKRMIAGCINLLINEGEIEIAEKFIEYYMNSDALEYDSLKYKIELLKRGDEKEIDITRMLIGVKLNIIDIQDLLLLILDNKESELNKLESIIYMSNSKEILQMLQQKEFDKINDTIFVGLIEKIVNHRHFEIYNEIAKYFDNCSKSQIVAIGNILYEKGYDVEALEMYQRGDEIDLDIDAYDNIISWLIKHNNQSEATKFISLAINLYPQDYRAYSWGIKLEDKNIRNYIEELAVGEFA